MVTAVVLAGMSARTPGTASSVLSNLHASPGSTRTRTCATAASAWASSAPCQTEDNPARTHIAIALWQTQMLDTGDLSADLGGRMFTGRDPEELFLEALERVMVE